MTPEYIECLADKADPDKLWKLSYDAQHALSVEERIKLDTAVALRRYANHLDRLRRALADKKSILITPLESNSTAIKSVRVPRDHERLRRKQT